MLRHSFERFLDIPTRTGDRNDTALFAHFAGIPLENEGHVHTDLLEQGWCWRIPLPDRVSVGFPGVVKCGVVDGADLWMLLK